MIDKDEIQQALEKLKTQRDELRVQMHLAKAEAKDVWENMEQKWNEFEPKAKQVGNAAAEASKDVLEAARQLGKEIKEGYEHIRKSL